MWQSKNRLIPMVSLLLVAGFVVTSLTSYLVSRASLRAQITDSELPLTRDNIYSEIQRDLLSPIFISSLMANDTFLRDWVLQGEEDDSRITRYLKEIQSKYKTFTSFFVSERTRTYYQANGPLKVVRADEPRDTWYFRVRGMKTDYEINVDADMANKDTMTIFINYRVYDYGGRYLGATGVGLAVGAVKELIASYQKRYNRDIFFADRTGQIRLHGSDFPEQADAIQDIDGLAALGPEIFARKDGAFRYLSHGRTMHLVTRYIPEFDWYLFVEQPEEQAISPIRRTLMINLAVCALVTGVVLLLTNLSISSYQRRLEKMASTDALTGIFNRRAFDIIIQQTLKEIRRKQLPVAVIMLDIDEFKQVNDTFGHSTGDVVLQHVVRLAQAHIRASDVLCRWGGEEFLILLRDCNREGALAMADKIRRVVREQPLFHEGQRIETTISLGVAEYRGGEAADHLFSRVDQAMYRAKQRGRDRVEVESPLPDAEEAS
jgi:diguanylate cyclase (GGDEF)-like protein